MRFFPYAVKLPLLGMELKRKRKEKEEDRKFKQLSNKHEACSHWSQNYFYCRLKESIYWQKTSIQPSMNFSVNKFLLAYLYKKRQGQNEQYLNTEITHREAKEKSLQNPLSQSVSHSFVLKCMLQIFISEMYPRTKTYSKQETEVKHQEQQPRSAFKISIEIFSK